MKRCKNLRGYIVLGPGRGYPHAGRLPFWGAKVPRRLTDYYGKRRK